MANKWIEHLKQVRKENPGKTLKECMQIAKKSYKKKDNVSWIDDAEKEQHRGMRRHKREWRDIP